MKKLIIIMAMVLLTGCASSRSVWVKDGVLEAEFKQDLYKCQKDAELLSYKTSFNRGIVGGVVDRRNRNLWFQRCMESKGYLLQSK